MLTDSPVLLRAYFPTAEGITVFDEDPWAPPTRLEELAARGAGRRRTMVLTWLRARTWLHAESPWRPQAPEERADRQAGAAGHTAAATHIGSRRAVGGRRRPVVVLGGGYLTDADAAQCRRVFALLRVAHDHDVPVAMIGQGLGPLDDPALVAMGREALRGVEMLALRERRRGPAIAARLGVPAIACV